MGLSCYLAMRYPDMMFCPYPWRVVLKGIPASASCATCGVLWTRDYLKEEEKKQAAESVPGESCAAKGKESAKTDENKVMVLTAAQWNIAHGKSGGGMACKGGHNEVYNHNDVGSFLYMLGDEMLLTDLGAGEYTKQYFGPERYQILCNSSFGPQGDLTGEGQKAGAEYGCSSFSADGRGGCEIGAGLSRLLGLVNLSNT